MTKKLIISLLLVGASLFAQAPSPLPQPSTPTYSVDQLALYPSYDRASYLAKFGVQAPAFDATKPAKAWFDKTVSCVPNLGTSFNVLSDNPSALTFSTMLVPSCDVANVNLPGTQTFEAFVPNTVSNVVLGVKGFGASGVGTLIQSTSQDALALQVEIGDPTMLITKNMTTGGTPFTYQVIDPTSSVGVYMVGKMNVEQALINRNANGVGSPGKWNKQSEGIYTWTSTVSSVSGSGADFVKVPVRNLLSNEKLTLSDMTILGAFAQVTRTDLSVAAPTGVSGGGLTAAQASSLAHIEAMLKALTGQ